MKQLLVIIFLLIIQWKSFAQKNEQANSHLYLKISPLFLIDIYSNSAFILSLESKKKSNSVSLDLGILYPFNIAGFMNNRGWRGGIEFRHYLKRGSSYIAVNYGYKNQQYDYTDTISIDGIPEYTKYHTYSKDIQFLNIMCGEQNISSNSRFFTNFYIGLGIRYKYTRSLGLTEQEIENRIYADSQSLPIINEVANCFIMNFVCGGKVGYIIR